MHEFKEGTPLLGIAAKTCYIIKTDWECLTACKAYQLISNGIADIKWKFSINFEINAPKNQKR